MTRLLVAIAAVSCTGCVCCSAATVLKWNAEDVTWAHVEIDGVVYGAKADERGPIGGGAGYVNVRTDGDSVV